MKCPFDRVTMAKEPSTLILRCIRKLAAAPGHSHVPDHELLGRFVAKRDEAAFEELLHRHGAMVLRACQRLLHQPQDAEDVFQATFLTLVRKAASIRTQGAVGGWLHGVARRLALQVRATRARAGAHENQGVTRPASDPLSEITLRDAEAVLHEELARLPEKYREPLVLCYLEGVRREDAAWRLGWSLGTLKRRLEQGRELLRLRLTRRGLTPSAALLAVLLAETSTPAIMPALLARGTAQAARLVAAGQAATGLISAEVANLLNGGTKAMFLTKLKIGLTLILIVTTIATGAGLVAHQAGDLEPANVAEKPAAKGAPPSKPDGAEPHATDRFGDPLPPGAVARMGTHRLRHPGVVEAVTFSSDSAILVAAGEDQTIRLWDRATGKEIRQLTGHRGPVTAVALSPDGKTLASASRDQTLILWEMATGKELGRCAGHQGEVWSVVFSPDGKALLSGGQDRTVRVWDARMGKEIRQLQGSKGGVSSLALSPDGKTLATASSERGQGGAGLDLPIRLWDVDAGKEVRQLSGHQSVITSVVFSPDGKGLAAASSELGPAGPVPTIRLWSVVTGEEDKQWTLQGTNLLRVAFAPDGKNLAAVVLSTTKADLAPNFTVRLLDADNGAEVKRLGTFPFKVSCLAFSSDGKQLAAGGGNKVLSLWELATGKALHEEGSHQLHVTSVAFSPDGKTLFSASYDATIRAWDVATGKETLRFNGHEGMVRSIAVSRDGKLLVSGGGTLSNTREKSLRLWDVATGKERDWATKGLGLVSMVAFSGDGKTVATAGALVEKLTIGQVIQLWDVDTGKEICSIPMPGGGGYTIALSPDGKTLATAGAGKDHWIRLWDTGTRKECGRCEGHEAEVLCLAFSADGRTLASAGRDRTIRLWETATGKERGKLEGHKDPVNAVVFAPDGQRLASGSSDRTIRLWDVATGKEVLRRTGHESGIKALGFSPDGTRLATGSFDTTILVWDVNH